MEILTPENESPSNVTMSSANVTSGISAASFPNKWVMNWTPTSNTAALLATGLGQLNYNSTSYDVTGAGHGIGWLGQVLNNTTRTMALAVGTEGVVESVGGGVVSQGWGVVSHLSTTGAGSTITAGAGFADIVDTNSSGAITAYAGLLLNDIDAVSNITYKYGVLQQSASAWNIFSGPMYGPQQGALPGVPVMPEVAPASSPGVASNRYYTTPTGTTISTLSIAANILYCCPFFVPERTTWTRIGAEITTAAAASSVMRVGVFSAYTGRPQALLLDSGALAADSTGLKEATVSKQLDSGWYFLAIFSNGSPTVRAILDTASTKHGLTTPTALDTLIGGSQTYGTMPSTFPASLIYANGGGVVPLLWMRKV